MKNAPIFAVQKMIKTKCNSIYCPCVLTQMSVYFNNVILGNLEFDNHRIG